MTATATPINARAYYGCPYWCVEPEDRHAVEVHGLNAVFDHDGPRFGPYISGGGSTIAGTGELLEVDVRAEVLGGTEFSAADLRQLAVDALAAAEWLEVQESSAVATV